MGPRGQGAAGLKRRRTARQASWKMSPGADPRGSTSSKAREVKNRDSVDERHRRWLDIPTALNFVYGNFIITGFVLSKE